MKIKLKLQMRPKSFLIMIGIVLLILIINVVSAGVWDDFLNLFSNKKRIDNLVGEDVYKKLILNDAQNTKAIITLNNPMETIDIKRDNIKVKFIQKCGKVNNYKLLINSTCIGMKEKEIIYGIKKVCYNSSIINNKTKENIIKEICFNETFIKDIIYEFYTYDCFKEFEKINAGDVRNIKLDADVSWDICSDGSFGYKIDWQFETIIDDGIDKIILDKKDWAWWNESKSDRICYNVSGFTENLPFCLNASYGIYINEVKQIGWVLYNTSISDYCSYYNDETDIVMIGNFSGNESRIPIEWEIGNSDSYLSENVWDNNFKQVLLLNDANSTRVNDSTSNNNDGIKQDTNEPNEIDGFIGKAQDFDGDNDYIDLTGLTAGTTYTLSFWTKMDVNEHNTYHLDIESGRILWQWAESGTDIEIYDGGAVWIPFGSTPTVDGWHYLVTTFNGSSSEISVYLNMTQLGSTESYTPRNIGDAVYMGSTKTPDGWINGKIDHWTISDVIRSDAFNNQTYLNMVGTSGFGNALLRESFVPPRMMGGIVKDSDDILVNNAKIIIINQATNKIVGTTNSNSTGGWNYTVDAGTYLVVAYDPNNSTRDGDADPYIIVS